MNSQVNKMRLLVILLLLSLTAISAFAQANPQRDRWHGLVIDESTSADAIRILGSPVSDKTDNLKVMMIKPWLSKEAKDKKYRYLEYKKIDDFSKVKLAFLDDKLVFIEFEPAKRMLVKDAAIMQGLDTRLIFETDDLSGKPGEFSKVRKGRTIGWETRKVYNIGAAEKTFIVCLLEGASKNDPVFMPSGGRYYVDVLQVTSRKIEIK